jgi:uncharacterized SAM-binding protein YcdF (DUF218 family)
MSPPLALLRALAKALMPGRLPFLLVGLAVGLLFLLFRGRAARWGRRWLALLVGGYALLSLQGVSDLLIDVLRVPHPRIERAADAPGVGVIVLLSNGAYEAPGRQSPRWVVNLQSGYGVREAARLYRVLGDPLVIASGGRGDGALGPPESQALTDALEASGVPADHILQEAKGQATRDQAVNVSTLLRARGVTRVLLVTTPVHMRRALGAFRAQGLDPIPAPSSLDYGGPAFWRPTALALVGSATAIHEYAALAYYELRGWI